MGLGCPVGKKSSNFLLAHLGWMPLVMEEDETLDPAHIGFLSPWAVVPRADRFAGLVEQPWLWCVRRKRDSHSGLQIPTCHVRPVVP